MELYKLTPKAKQAMSIAKKEAQLLKNKYAGTEHLLLGLLNIGDSIIIQLLEEFEIDLDELRNIVYDNISQEGDEQLTIDDIAYTPRVEKVIELAHTCALKLERDKIDVEHIFLGLLYETDGVANNILQSLGISYNKVRSQINHELGGDLSTTNSDEFVKDDDKILKLKHLQKYGIDLTRLAARGKIDPVIGRQEEITRLIQILCRKTKNNPVLVGEAGVGKTAVAEGLAQRIAQGKVPAILASKHVISLDLALMVAGTKYRGQFEERVKNVLDEIKKNKNVIIFLDEIHMIVGAGSAEGTMDASNMLKPALARGELRCIGATTPDEFRESIESDNALERRFQPIQVKEPNIDDVVQILEGIKTGYEKHHDVKYTESSLIAAAKLSKRYITDRNLPDKAIDVMDEAGALNHAIDEYVEQITRLSEKITMAKNKKENLIKGQQFEDACLYRDEEKKLKEQYDIVVQEQAKARKQVLTIDKGDMEKIISRMVGVPVISDDRRAGEKILGLEDKLKEIVIGQDPGIKCICDSLTRSVARMQDPDRPIGSFLFVGGTGVGKTYLAKMLAKEIFDSEDNLIQIDMSELMESHSVSKLVGSPPGYIGYNKGGKLTEKIRRNPYSLVIFDEIEKAHGEVLNILLQILEEGKLTDGLGRAVNFKNSIIIMTTNIGAEKVLAPVPMGFLTPTDDEKKAMASDGALEEVKKQFKAEFINRVDEMVVFNNLTKDNMSVIVDLNFAEYVRRANEHHNITVTLDDSARKLFLEEGYDEKNGARELRRTIQRLFETEISLAIVEKRCSSGDTVLCRAEDNKLVLEVSTHKSS